MTHFLCIPLSNPSSKAQLEEFLDDFEERLLHLDEIYDVRVGEESVRPCEHLFEGAIQPLDTINLNLGMMSLTTEQQVHEVTEFLKNLDMDHVQSITESDNEYDSEDRRPCSCNRFTVDLRISDNEWTCSHESIFCLQLDANDCLLKFCKYVQSELSHHGYLIPNDEHAGDLLHAVVMDTNQARPVRVIRGRDGKKKRKGGALKVNFCSLLTLFSRDGFRMRDVHLEKLAICKIKRKKVFDDQGELVGKELDEVASIPLRSSRTRRSAHVPEAEGRQNPWEFLIGPVYQMGQ